MVGIRSLGWCITLSLVYSVGSYLAAWVTGTPGAFGQVTLMDVRWSPAWAPSWLPRLLVAAVIAGLGVFSFWYYSSGWIHRFPEWMVERLDWGREGAALATAPFVAFCVVPGGLLAVAVVVAVVVAGFGAGAGIVAGAGGGEARLIALLFWLAMPYINGLLDWISLSVSRWFGRAILAERDSPRSLAITVGLALADLLAAVAFAFTVAWLLAFGVEASALVLDLSLDLEQYVKAAAEAPWTAGFWASFMVLSTLLPSAFHLMLALGAVLVAWSGNPLRAWAVQKLKSADEADWLWPQLYLTFGWCVPAIVAPLGLLWLVAQGVGLIEPLPAALRDTAFHGIATAQAWLL